MYKYRARIYDGTIHIKKVKIIRELKTSVLLTPVGGTVSQFYPKETEHTGYFDTWALARSWLIDKACQRRADVATKLKSAVELVGLAYEFPHTEEEAGKDDLLWSAKNSHSE